MTLHAHAGNEYQPGDLAHPQQHPLGSRLWSRVADFGGILKPERTRAHDEETENEGRRETNRVNRRGVRGEISGKRQPEDPRHHPRYANDEEGFPFSELVRKDRQDRSAEDSSDEHQSADQAIGILHAGVFGDGVRHGADRVEDTKAHEEQEQRNPHVPLFQDVLHALRKGMPLQAFDRGRRGWFFSEGTI